MIKKEVEVKSINPAKKLFKVIAFKVRQSLVPSIALSKKVNYQKTTLAIKIIQWFYVDSSPHI